MIIPLIVSSLLLITAYLLGSIPTGYLVGRYLKGIDIREYGSGSTGATNVLRTLGIKAGIAVLTVDLLKGSLAVLLIRLWFDFTIFNIIPSNWQDWLVILAALTAVIGHSKSVWLNFSGGKSVATTLGVLLVMTPLVALGALTSFLLVLAVSRIVSLSSIIAAIAVNILMISLQKPLPYLLFAALAGGYVIIRHRSNMERLLAGIEPKISDKVET